MSCSVCVCVCMLSRPHHFWRSQRWYLPCLSSVSPALAAAKHLTYRHTPPFQVMVPFSGSRKTSQRTPHTHTHTLSLSAGCEHGSAFTVVCPLHALYLLREVLVVNSSAWRGPALARMLASVHNDDVAQVFIVSVCRDGVMMVEVTRS